MVIEVECDGCGVVVEIDHDDDAAPEDALCEDCDYRERMEATRDWVSM